MNVYTQSMNILKNGNVSKIYNFISQINILNEKTLRHIGNKVFKK